MVVGVAAHITAAASGGPRFDPTLTSEKRSDQANGIWLCEIHAKAIDSDISYFSVELLKEWKKSAEQRAFLQISTLKRDVTPPVTAPEDQSQLVIGRVISGAKMDLAAYRRTSGWPRNPIELSLRVSDGQRYHSFNGSGFAAVLDAFNEIAIIAPPGTGKTTTLLQVAGVVLEAQRAAAAFIPLSEWSTRPISIFEALLRRRSYRDLTESDFAKLADQGRLVLLFDGWNELDQESRKLANVELTGLRRDYPEIRLVVSSRRQALDVPIAGPRVEISPLSESEQLAIANALGGAAGREILDRAWRIRGIRDLMAVPLYLTTLLTHAPLGTLPTTKEEILRLFVGEYERSTKNAEALRRELFGFHPDMLKALAVEATTAANTSISVSQALSVVGRTERELVASHRITAAPQPALVIDTLINHHTLVRSGAENGSVLFQHQQFQEWYTSFRAEELMIAASDNDAAKLRMLRASVLNSSDWEEAILFACERLSRASQNGCVAVADAVLEAIVIAPMLAAEMIFRSDDGVWKRIKDPVVAFAQRWHKQGNVDRATQFMITTGQAAFASEIWQLLQGQQQGGHLRTLRKARVFRPSVLGPDLARRSKELPTQKRAEVLSEIARNGGIEGIELATDLARRDVDDTVQIAVIEALIFSRAEAFIGKILATASEEVWQQIANRGYAEDIGDPKVAMRLKQLRESYIEAHANPIGKILALLDLGNSDAARGQRIATLIEDPTFDPRDQHAGFVVDRAHSAHPDSVSAALVRRLEKGLDLPVQSIALLKSLSLAVDDGPIVDLLLSPTPRHRKAAVAALSVIGARTVGKLIDSMVALEAQIQAERVPSSDSKREEFWRLSNNVSETNVNSFAKAILERAATDDPKVIARLADLIGRHGKGEDQGELQLDSTLRGQINFAVNRWVDVLLSSASTKRLHLAEVARAIGRLASPSLLQSLERLLLADLARWRQARQELRSTVKAARHPDSDAHMSWTLQYQRAFAAIGDEPTIDVLKTYLRDEDFGFEAACALKSIWRSQQPEDKASRFQFWPDYSDVKARRNAKSASGAEPALSGISEAILSVIRDFARLDATKANQRRGLQLAKVAFSMPYKNQQHLIAALLQLPHPPSEKLGLLTVLVIAGEVIPSELLVDGIDDLLNRAETNAWLLDENRGEIENWLELLPFSSHPLETLNCFKMVRAKIRPLWRYRRLLHALGEAPSPEAETVLAELPRIDPEFLNEQNWLAAFSTRDSLSAARILLDLVCSGGAGDQRGQDPWMLSKTLASAIQKYPDFRAEVYARYDEAHPRLKSALETAIVSVADSEGILVLIRGYAARHRQFDSNLRTAIRSVAIGERAVPDWPGAKEAYGVPIPDLRKTLFAMSARPSAEGRLALLCLSAIDELRDEYGPAESEPLHPDIESDRPWPALDQQL
jgi:hypothetical protein